MSGALFAAFKTIAFVHSLSAAPAEAAHLVTSPAEEKKKICCVGDESGI